MAKEIIRGQDGVCRWSHEFKLWRNPTIFITTAKIFAIAIQAPALLMFFLELENGLLSALKIYLLLNLLMGGGFAVLLLLAYSFVALLHAGNYCVYFEMDENGIRHVTMEKHIKKNQILSMITVLSGIAAKNPSTVGAGLLAGSKTSSYSKFSKVKSVTANRKRRVIYINEMLNKNQIYTSPEDFDFVSEYIIAHTPKAKIKIK